MEGWIKIHKRLREHEILKDDTAYKLFTVILMYVKTNTGKYTAGRFQLGEMAKMKPITAYKALKRLEKKWKMVTLVSNNQYTEITVLNWGKYQGKEDDGNSLGNNAVTPREQRGNTKKEIRTKKEEEEMSEKSDAPSQFDTFWNSYPKKELKKKSQEIWKRKKLDKHLPDILAFIEKAKRTDRWKKGFVKQPTTFLNNESWNDDLTSYGDNASPPEKSYTDNGWNASKETHEQFLERTKKIALKDQVVSPYARELTKTLKV